ncbi:MAG TPA: NAD(P)H-binding protein [Longimicrobium sp.]|jgi:uncharacterized protein YbjT (DUF2867 family)|uniref:NAD(P)H-binding protein n=1 Tax=Longimicrobium sp. TaxID=2029185 RepID=UPI002ED7A5B6
MKVLVFGATGGAGGSVVRACAASPAVAEVRAVARRPLGFAHDKLRVSVHGDFLDYEPIADAFTGVDACLWCLGISATQVPDEAAYRLITHDFAVAAARMLAERSPGAAFHYVSGQGAGLDSRMMWARVKAETERDLMRDFGAVCWRPAFIDGEDSPNAPRFLQAMRPFFRVLRPFAGLYVAGQDIGRAMIQATAEGQRARIIGNRELRQIASRAPASAA